MKSLRHLVPLFVVLTLAAMLAGCSKDSTPTSPSPLDTTAPAAPTQFAGVPDEVGSGMHLAWTPSTSANVASYEVYRYSPSPNRESAFVLYGQTDAATASLALKANATPTTQVYRLRAVSGTGIASAWTPTLTVQVPARTTETGEIAPVD